MSKFLIFGGTSEEHKIIQELWQKHDLTLCITSQYGAQLVENTENKVKISVGRKDLPEIIELIKNEKYDGIIDATHPYAKIITENLKKASKETGVNYYRVIREKSSGDNCILVNSIAEAADFLKNTSGNILLTTGSKELKPFTEIENFEERIYPRVLPTVDSINICTQLRFSSSHIIAVQGPFSEELNTAMMKQFKIKYMVTKDGGKAGGFPEKISAAEKMNVGVILINREPETGYSMEELVEMLLKKE